MSNVSIAAKYILDLCMQADVKNNPRVSISFDNPKDKYLFITECKRQMKSENISFDTGPFDLKEMTIHGIAIRIL
jgi:hypothetical protein